MMLPACIFFYQSLVFETLFTTDVIQLNDCICVCVRIYVYTQIYVYVCI
jgi:hypothetical protein